MLETLDSIPWSTLHHAYGPAHHVPGLIRDLASPKKTIREAASWKLSGNIYHQGTVYSSTAFVVPFFLELLEQEQVKDKADLLDFLDAIAHGTSALDVHVRNEEERNTPAFQRQLAEELGWVQAAKDAVSSGYATYLRLLGGRKARIRACSAWVLANCQPFAEQVIPALQAYMAREDKQLVRASIILSLGHLMPATTETRAFFTRVLAEQTKPLLKITAAMAYAFAVKETAPAEVVQILLEGYQQPRALRKKFLRLPFAKVDLEASLSKAFRAIGVSLAPQVVPTLTRALKRSDALSGLVLVENLLFLALEGQVIPPEMTAADLTEMQRQALSTLVKSKNVWGLGNMDCTVGHFFPPQYEMDVSLWFREDVAQFLRGEKRC